MENSPNNDNQTYILAGIGLLGIIIFIYFVYFYENPQTEEINSQKENAYIICDYNKYDCEDFNNYEDAKNIYNECYKKKGYDVHYLDADKDGIVCESTFNSQFNNYNPSNYDEPQCDEVCDARQIYCWYECSE